MKHISIIGSLRTALLLLYLFMGLRVNAQQEKHKLFSQVIDLRAKGDTTSHYHLETAQDSLLRSLVSNLMAGKIIAYADSGFAQPLSIPAVINIVTAQSINDTAFTYAPGGDIDEETIISVDFDFYALTDFKILSLASGTDSKTIVQILGVAPYWHVPENANKKYMNQYRRTKTMFWLRYADVQEILEQYDARHPGNEFRAKLWEIKVPETDVLYLENGDKYIGYLKNGKPNGIGTIYTTDGSTCTGQWKNGRQTGEGTYLAHDGWKYVGHFEDGKFSGEGTYYWADSSKYIGHFEDDRFNGNGTKYDNNGDKYTGQWKDDKMSGEGTFTWATGEKYVGEWKSDLRCGKGMYISDDYKYIGSWKDDVRSGKGILYTHDSDVYIGNWENDVESGHGTYYWAIGDKYDGEWKDGYMNGYGVFEIGNKGKYDVGYCPDCVIYKGSYEKDKRSGDGTCYDIYGNILYQGKFLDDKPVGPYPANK